MPPFNRRELQQQLRAFLVFIQLHIMMYLLFLCRPQQPPPAPPPPPPPPAAIQRPRRRHNMWVRPWLLQREERGGYHNIMAELYATDIPGFTNYMRMTPEFFEMIKTRLESQAGHQVQSSNQCWEKVSPHHQISGHWRVIHIIILSVQGWQICHFYQRSAGPSRMSSPESTSDVLLLQMSGKNWKGNSGSGGMFHMPWVPLMASMWP